MKAFACVIGCAIILINGCSAGEPAPAAATADAAQTTEVAPVSESTQGDVAASIREKGPPGLDALLGEYANLVAKMRSGATPLDDEAATALRTKIDAVAKQRDAHASGLYWYTDLELAKAEAVRTHRHILSLRMLGNLDEEFSCANSRFFRTVLYANTAVSRYLHDHYVLHWKSVRPAPLVTIDMGDGRRLKRTITGNSIHYILDSDGTVLDALPGLYAPTAFLAALERGSKLSDRSVALRAWHGAQADELCHQWLVDAIRSGMYGDTAIQTTAGQDELITQYKGVAFPKRHLPEIPSFSSRPTEFDSKAFAKSMVERPISRGTAPAAPAQPAVSPLQLVADPENRPLAERMTNEWWQKLAALHQADARLDQSSRRLMMAKLPSDAVRVDERTAGGVVDERTPFARTLRRFEAAIAQDTVRNEYLFHAQIHQWLEEDEKDLLRVDVESLNKRVYRELFLTPDHDVWLGLVPDDTYTALEKDGCACDKGAGPMSSSK